MPDEYDPSTVKAWDNFAAAVKYRSRDFLAGFAPKPKMPDYWAQLAREQNCSLSQAAFQNCLQNQTFHHPQNYYASPIAGLFATLGI